MRKWTLPTGLRSRMRGFLAMLHTGKRAATIRQASVGICFRVMWAGPTTEERQHLVSWVAARSTAALLALCFLFDQSATNDVHRMRTLKN